MAEPERAPAEQTPWTPPAIVARSRTASKPFEAPARGTSKRFEAPAAGDARATHCPCGCPLDQPATGRPKRFCCAWCRWRAKTAPAAIARRQAWIVDWQEAAAAGEVDPDEADRLIAAWEEDIGEFARRLQVTP